MKAGDILVSTWGYDQTNADFYKVIEVKGIWVKFKKLKERETETPGGYMTGTTIPLNEFESAKVYRRKLHVTEYGEYVSINTYASAHLWDGKPVSVSHYA